MLTQYIDFEIRFHSHGKSRYTVVANSSTGGDADGIFVFPTSATYQALAARLAQLDVDEDALSKLGQLLFSALFQGQIRDLYNRSQGALRPEQGLRLRLHIDSRATMLMALPWEFLYDPIRGPLVMLDASIMRYLPQPASIPSLKIDLPLKVLVTSAHTPPPANVERELNEVTAALGKLGQHVQITIEPHLTPQKLQGLLRQGFHVWHFVGHGGFAKDGVAGQLYFEDATGDVEAINAMQLGVLLNRSGVRLIMLDACNGAKLSTDPFRSMAPALIRAQIPAVVAMQFTVPEETTRAFADTFYRTLAEGFPIDACVTEGRKAVMIASGLHNPNWGIPVVYTRAPDGQLFDLLPTLIASEIKVNSMSMPQAERNQLIQFIRSHFNDGELHDLCLDMNTDYDDLPGQGKGDKVRELVRYAERYGSISKLIERCRHLRPHVKQNIGQINPPADLQKPSPQEAAPSKIEQVQLPIPPPDDLREQLFKSRLELSDIKKKLDSASSSNTNTTEQLIALHNDIDRAKLQLATHGQPMADRPDDHVQTTFGGIVAIGDALLAKETPSKDERDLAWTRYQQAIQIAKRTGFADYNPSAITDIYLKLGANKFSAGDSASSHRYLNEGLRFVGPDDSQDRLRLMLEQTRVYLDEEGKQDRALKNARETNALAERLGYPRIALGQSLLYLAVALRNVGKRKDFLKCISDAITIFEEEGNGYYEVMAKANRASEFIDSGYTERAIKDFLAIQDKISDKRQSATLSLNLAAAYTDNGNLEQAEFYAKLSFQQHEKLSVPDERGKFSSLVMLGEVMKEQFVQLSRADQSVDKLFREAEAFLQERIGDINSKFGDLSIIPSVVVSDDGDDELPLVRANMAELHRILADLYLVYASTVLDYLSDANAALIEAENLSTDIDVNVAARVKITRAQYLYQQRSYDEALEKLRTAEDELLEHDQQREIVPLMILRARILAASAQLSSACQELKEARQKVKRGIRTVFQDQIDQLARELSCIA
jgi:tetratricopeptide (TPR) repeat protein